MPVSSGYELSSQQRLFFIQGKESATAGIAALLEGPAAPEKIRAAADQIAQRHEILRTSFQRRTGMKFPFQVVHEAAAFTWEEVDLTGLSREEQRSRIAGFVRDGSKLDIEKGHVLHARVATLERDVWALVLTFSALCVDDASLNELLREFGDAYARLASADDVLQYADYSEWQTECLAGTDEEADAASNFWAKTEFDSLPAPRIPFKRGKGIGQSTRESVPVPVNFGSQPGLREFLFSAWQGFLTRICGRTEFCLGYLSDGRNHEEFSSGVGLYARGIPVRVDFATDGSFRDYQSSAASELSKALDFQDYFSPDRAGNHLTVGFSFQELSSRKNTGSLAISEVSRFVPAAFRLQLRCEVSSEAVQLFLDYDRAFFDPGIVAQLAEGFAVFAAGARAEPDSRVSALPIMSDAQRHRVLTEFNQTAAEYPSDQCIHQLFEEQVKRHPDRPALRCGERELTYAELNREANRIAHVLVTNGIAANVSVALCIERSAEMIIALLGILKAGGCYVPLVPDNPKPRLAHQLAETSAPIVLTEQKHLSSLPEFKGRIICLDRDQALLRDAPESNPAVTTSAENLAYVIYTSGSTGTPKGVAVRHFNLVNYSHFMCRRLKLDEYPDGLNFATVSTISADLGNTCIFPSLISGGCLHVIGYETAMSPALFADYNAHHPIDVLKITPSQLSSLLNNEQDVSVLPREYLILGGEAGRWDLIERIRKSGKCNLLNHYGPTEATVGCCTFDAKTDVSAWEPATLPIGRPIANDTVYILDANMQPVPVGVAGELAVGGTGLALGYLNQQQQTAERFVRNPFSTDPAARLYRTGDLARFLPDGNIEFLGRIDSQVKVRGFRVEPAEIEAVLKRHPGVAQAAVISYEREPEGKKLAAYVLGRSPVRTEELRAFVGQQLPDYMVPSAFVLVDSLPLTANGKLDVRALPAPEQPAPAREQVAPRTSAEEKMVKIWEEVLRLESVGVTDNFFELGGHSLLATQIISRIRNTFRVQVPLASFLQNPTITALAQEIGNCPAVESEEEEMARLLQELEGISEEEAERLLAGDKDSNARRR